jgi:hypothetical protein
MNQILRIRSFYSVNIPKGNRITLSDGSKVLIPVAQQLAERLPPRVRTYPPRATLTNEQVKEIQLKRQSDPDRFTVLQLAKEYNTFPGFIMRLTRCPQQRKEKLLKEAEDLFERLTLSKKKATIDRLRRKALW